MQWIFHVFTCWVLREGFDVVFAVLQITAISLRTATVLSKPSFVLDKKTTANQQHCKNGNEKVFHSGYQLSQCLIFLPETPKLVVFPQALITAQ